MRPSRPGGDDAGSAVVEFIVLGVLVLVPMTYIVQAVMVVHSGVLASAQAAREAARAFSASSTVDEGRTMAMAAARLAFADQGLPLPADALVLQCVDGGCLSPGSAVVVSVAWRVQLPWLPHDWAADASVPVSSRARVPVDDFRSSQAGQS